MIEEKEILELIPIRQSGWSDEMMCLWMARAVERKVCEIITKEESKARDLWQNCLPHRNEYNQGRYFAFADAASNFK